MHHSDSESHGEDHRAPAPDGGAAGGEAAGARSSSDGERSSSRSRPSRSGSARRRCACWRTTGRSRARRCASSRARGGGSRAERERPRRDGALARAAPGEPVRRDARDAGADSYRRDVHLPLQFPDPGLYWFHPHIREDYGQEMGLYGNIVVARRSPATGRGPPRAPARARRHADRGRARSRRSAPETTHVAMGRFGNVMLLAASRISRSRPSAARSCASTSPTRRTRASSRWRCPGPG